MNLREQLRKTMGVVTVIQCPWSSLQLGELGCDKEPKEHCLNCITDAILHLVADDIDRTHVGKLPVGLSGTLYDNYIKGAKNEHDYIVEYLRGLLDT